MIPTPSCQPCRCSSERLRGGERALGEALGVLGVVVLHDEVLDVGVRERRHQRLPVDGAVAEVGPAVLVGVGAGGGDVLEVDGGQAPAEGLDPLEGIGAALDDPGEVGLPFEVGAALEDRDLRDEPSARCSNSKAWLCQPKPRPASR